jgi:predicted LPLAT superfamily acyltransferase
MPADRCFGSQKSVGCQFFGTTAQFPLGPFATAVQKEVPALAVMVMKEGSRRYRAFVRQLPVDTTLPHRKQMAALAQAFATELESIVRRYPHQWYNYYEFWDGTGV